MLRKRKSIPKHLREYRLPQEYWNMYSITVFPPDDNVIQHVSTRRQESTLNAGALVDREN